MRHSFALICAVLAALALTVPPGQAEAPGARFQSEQVTLSLVAERPDANGTIRAALLVNLAPGWKTYWRDPGDAGIPPSLDFAASRNLGLATVRYPAPIRFGDEFGMSNGYAAPVAFAIELHQPIPGEESEIRLKLMIGVCRQICIPVSTELTLALPDDAGAQKVAAAFAALPALNRPETGIGGARLSADGQALLVELAAPVDPASRLFVAGPKGWSFGTAELSLASGVPVFTVPVQAKPRIPSPAPLQVHAVLVSGDTAIEAPSLAVGNAPGTSTAGP